MKKYNRITGNDHQLYGVVEMAFPDEILMQYILIGSENWQTTKFKSVSYFAICLLYGYFQFFHQTVQVRSLYIQHFGRFGLITAGRGEGFGNKGFFELMNRVIQRKADRNVLSGSVF